jgi:hypothetical protein
MKTMKLVLVFAFLMMSGSRLRAQTGATEQLVVPLSEPGKPVTIEARLVYGSIKVIGYEGKDVIVEIHADTTDRDEDNESGGMRRIPNRGGLDVRAEESDNKVSIQSGAMEQRLKGITIKVPQNTARVVIGTVNNGDVVISNVSGKIEVGNVNGAITVTGVSGSVVANTVNGNVIVVFKTIDGNAPMAFSTLNGKIDITLPGDAKADLKLKSGNGQMFTDFDIAIDKTKPKVETTNEDHFHQVKIDEWVHGKINGGGPEFMMQTTFGSIYIRKAK